MAGTVLVGSGVDVEVAGTVLEGEGEEVAAAAQKQHARSAALPGMPPAQEQLYARMRHIYPALIKMRLVLYRGQQEGHQGNRGATGRKRDLHWWGAAWW